MTRMTDYIVCPHCGRQIPPPSRGRELGRKPLDVDVTNIRDALRSHRDIARAASSLGCSRGYICAVLKKHGTTPKEVIQEK